MTASCLSAIALTTRPYISREGAKELRRIEPRFEHLGRAKERRERQGARSQRSGSCASGCSILATALQTTVSTPPPSGPVGTVVGAADFQLCPDQRYRWNGQTDLPYITGRRNAHGLDFSPIDLTKSLVVKPQNAGGRTPLDLRR